jgi:hypothetical protein
MNKRFLIPLGALLLAGAVGLPAHSINAAELDFEDDPVPFGQPGAERGQDGSLHPAWLYGYGQVGPNAYRLVLVAQAGSIDLYLTQGADAACSIKRFKSADATGKPVGVAVNSVAVPTGATSLMMRLAQSSTHSYVYLYNESEYGSCAVSVQMTQS